MGGNPLVSVWVGGCVGGCVGEWVGGWVMGGWVLGYLRDQWLCPSICWCDRILRNFCIAYWILCSLYSWVALVDQDNDWNPNNTPPSLDTHGGLPLPSTDRRTNPCLAFNQLPLTSTVSDPQQHTRKSMICQAWVKSRYSKILFNNWSGLLDNQILVYFGYKISFVFVTRYKRRARVLFRGIRVQ